MKKIIELQNVSFSYDKDEVLKDINLTINQGEYITIVGHNGSGKSTLIKLLNAIIIPSKGDVLVEGKNTKDEKNILDIRKTCGMVFQNPDNQLVATTVEEDVAFGLENIGIKSEEMDLIIKNALKAVSMEDFAKKQPHMLSGGQKQRVAIAGVLAMKPKVILLDEATAMLDPKGKKEVVEATKILNKQYGITIIHVTHDMNQAFYSDRTIVVNDGEIIIDDIPKNVFKDERLKQLSLDLPPVVLIATELRDIINFENDFTLEGVIKKICQYK